MPTRTFYAFRFEWAEKIAHLAPMIRLEIHEAAAYFAEKGELPDMSEEALAAFNEYLMPDFRRRAKAAEYRARAKARKEQVKTDEESAPATSDENCGEDRNSEETPAVMTTDNDQPTALPEPKLTYEQRRRLKRKLRRAQKREKKAAAKNQK